MEYKGKKQFKVTHNWHNEMSCVIEIDFNQDCVMDKIQEMVEFWSGWENRLSFNDGDYVKTFLKLTASTVQWISISDNYNTWGVRFSFTDREGWYPMDGSHGINILTNSRFEWDDDDFEVEEVSGIVAEPHPFL